MSQVLDRYLPNHVVTVEMVATENERHDVSIEKAIQVAVHHYRDALAGDII